MKTGARSLALEKIRVTLNLLKKSNLWNAEHEATSITELKALQRSLRNEPNGPVDPVKTFAPFLSILRTENLAGPFKLAALDAIQSFIGYNIFTQVPTSTSIALADIVDAVTNFKFVQTDVTSDNLVHLHIVQTLHVLISNPSISSELTDESAWEVMEACHGLLFSYHGPMRSAIQELAERTVLDAVRLLFGGNIHHIQLGHGHHGQPHHNHHHHHHPPHSHSGGVWIPCALKVLSYFVASLERFCSDPASSSTSSSSSSSSSTVSSVSLSSTESSSGLGLGGRRMSMGGGMSKLILNSSANLNSPLSPINAGNLGSNSNNTGSVGGGMGGSMAVIVSNLTESTLSMEVQELLFSLRAIHAMLRGQGGGSVLPSPSISSPTAFSSDHLSPTTPPSSSSSRGLVSDSAARDFILSNPSLTALVREDLSRCLVMLAVKRDLPLAVLQSILGIFSTMLSTLGPSLRVMVECVMRHVYLKALHQLSGMLSIQLFTQVLIDGGSTPPMASTAALAAHPLHTKFSTQSSMGLGGAAGVSSGASGSGGSGSGSNASNSSSSSSSSSTSNFSLDELEVILESLSDLISEQSFLPSIFASFDCDPSKPDLVRPLIFYLGQCSKAATRLQSYDPSPLDYLASQCLITLETVLGSLSIALSTPVPTLAELEDLYQEEFPGSPPPTHGAASHPPSSFHLSSSSSASSDSKVGLDISEGNEEEKENKIESSSTPLSISTDSPHFFPSPYNTSSSSSSSPSFLACERLKTRRELKVLLSRASELFVQKPEKGLRYLQENGVLPSPLTPQSVAEFLRVSPDLPKEATGAYLGELGKDNPKFEGDGKDFHVQVLLSYVKSFELTGQNVLDCLRIFLSAFRLPGEAQQIDRILVAFCEHCHASCRESSLGILENSDITYLLTFSIIMLNTDRHNPNIRSERKMTIEQFVRNNINYGSDLKQTIPIPRDYLEGIYRSISDCPIRTERNDMSAVLTPEVWVDMQLQATVNPEKGIMLTTASTPMELRKFEKSLMFFNTHSSMMTPSTTVTSTSSSSSSQTTPHFPFTSPIHSASSSTPSSSYSSSSSSSSPSSSQESAKYGLSQSRDPTPFATSISLCGMNTLVASDLFCCIWQDLVSASLDPFLSSHHLLDREPQTSLFASILKQQQQQASTANATSTSLKPTSSTPPSSTSGSSKHNSHSSSSSSSSESSPLESSSFFSDGSGSVSNFGPQVDKLVRGRPSSSKALRFSIDAVVTLLALFSFVSSPPPSDTAINHPSSSSSSSSSSLSSLNSSSSNSLMMKDLIDSILLLLLDLAGMLKPSLQITRQILSCLWVEEGLVRSGCDELLREFNQAKSLLDSNMKKKQQKQLQLHQKRFGSCASNLSFIGSYWNLDVLTSDLQSTFTTSTLVQSVCARAALGTFLQVVRNYPTFIHQSWFLVWHALSLLRDCGLLPVEMVTEASDTDDLLPPLVRQDFEVHLKGVQEELAGTAKACEAQAIAEAVQQVRKKLESDMQFKGGGENSPTHSTPRKAPASLLSLQGLGEVLFGTGSSTDGEGQRGMGSSEREELEEIVDRLEREGMGVKHAMVSLQTPRKRYSFSSSSSHSSTSTSSSHSSSSSSSHSSSSASLNSPSLSTEELRRVVLGCPSSRWDALYEGRTNPMGGTMGSVVRDSSFRSTSSFNDPLQQPSDGESSPLPISSSLKRRKPITSSSSSPGSSAATSTSVSSTPIDMLRELVLTCGVNELVSESRFLPESALCLSMQGLIRAAENERDPYYYNNYFPSHSSSVASHVTPPTPSPPSSSLPDRLSSLLSSFFSQSPTSSTSTPTPTPLSPFSNSCPSTAWLEMILVEIALRNRERDRFQLLWPLLCQHYSRTIGMNTNHGVGAASTSGEGSLMFSVSGERKKAGLTYSFERRVVGLLRIASRMVNREGLTQPILSTISHLLLPSATSHSSSSSSSSFYSSMSSHLSNPSTSMFPSPLSPSIPPALLNQVAGQIVSGLWRLITSNVSLLPQLSLDQWQSLFLLVAECAGVGGFSSIKSFEVMAWLLHEPRLRAEVPVFCVIGVKPLLLSTRAPASVSEGAAKLLLHLHTRLDVLVSRSESYSSSPSPSPSPSSDESYEKVQLSPPISISPTKREEVDPSLDTPVLWESCWLPILEALSSGIHDPRPSVRAECVESLCVALLDKHSSVVPVGVLVEVFYRVLLPTTLLLAEDLASDCEEKVEQHLAAYSRSNPHQTVTSSQSPTPSSPMSKPTPLGKPWRLVGDDIMSLKEDSLETLTPSSLASLSVDTLTLPPPPPPPFTSSSPSNPVQSPEENSVGKGDESEPTSPCTNQFFESTVNWASKYSTDPSLLSQLLSEPLSSASPSNTTPSSSSSLLHPLPSVSCLLVLGTVFLAQLPRFKLHLLPHPSTLSSLSSHSSPSSSSLSQSDVESLWRRVLNLFGFLLGSSFGIHLQALANLPFPTPLPSPSISTTPPSLETSSIIESSSSSFSLAQFSDLFELIAISRKIFLKLVVSMMNHGIFQESSSSSSPTTTSSTSSSSSSLWLETLERISQFEGGKELVLLLLKLKGT